MLSLAPEVVTLGETMVLFWPASGGTLEDATQFSRSFAGAESNMCIALSRLGHRTRWISLLGNDPFGGYIRVGLEREGVAVDASTDSDLPTAVFFKEQEPRGPRRVLYYRRGSAASRLSPADLRPDQFAGARVLHLTGITPALSSSCSAAVDRAIDLAREAGLLVCVDANVRLQLWDSRESARAALQRLIACADIALVGDEDAETVFPGLAEAAILQVILRLGPRSAVLKLGARGASAIIDGEFLHVDPWPVTVVDTVGAGDGFDAGFIAGILRGLSPQRRLQLGARVGAAAVTVPGDWEGYPMEADIEGEMSEG